MKKKAHPPPPLPFTLSLLCRAAKALGFKCMHRPKINMASEAWFFTVDSDHYLEVALDIQYYFDSPQKLLKALLSCKQFFFPAVLPGKEPLPVYKHLRPNPFQGLTLQEFMLKLDILQPKDT